MAPMPSEELEASLVGGAVVRVARNQATRPDPIRTLSCAPPRLRAAHMPDDDAEELLA